MDELLSLLPALPNVVLVPVIMLITAASAAIIVVGVRALIRLIVRLIGSGTHKGTTK